MYYFSSSHFGMHSSLCGAFSQGRKLFILRARKVKTKTLHNTSIMQETTPDEIARSVALTYHDLIKAGERTLRDERTHRFAYGAFRPPADGVADDEIGQIKGVFAVRNRLRSALREQMPVPRFMVLPRVVLRILAACFCRSTHTEIVWARRRLSGAGLLRKIQSDK